MQILKTTAAGVAFMTMYIFAFSDAPSVTAGDASTTCVTLARITSILAGQKRGQDAASLYRAYEIVKPYANSSTVEAKKADEYINSFAQWNPSLFTVQVPVGGGNFTNMTIDDMAGKIYSDPDHQSAVLVIGKDGSFQTLHSTMAAKDLTNVLKQNGAIALGRGIR